MHKENIRRLDHLLSQMNRYSQTPSTSWRNLKLATEAYDLLTAHLPLRCAHRITPYTRIRCLSRMLEAIDVLSVPRLAIQLLHYQNAMFELIRDAEDRSIDMAYDGWHDDAQAYSRPLQRIQRAVEYSEKRLQQYADLEIPADVWCERYNHPLRFDPVERTFEWEMQIYEVERECHDRFSHTAATPMDIQTYWTAKKEAWKRRGVEWRCPSEMNPGMSFASAETPSPIMS